MKPRTYEDLNPVLRNADLSKTAGFLTAANIVNDMGATCNGYAAGDCMLFKLNYLKKRQVRKVKP